MLQCVTPHPSPVANSVAYTQNFDFLSQNVFHSAAFGDKLKNIKCKILRRFKKHFISKGNLISSVETLSVRYFPSLPYKEGPIEIIVLFLRLYKLIGPHLFIDIYNLRTTNDRLLKVV